MTRRAEFRIIGSILIDDEYGGYSKDELETELSMAMDDDVKDISNGRVIGTLSISDIYLTEPEDVEVLD